MTPDVIFAVALGGVWAVAFIAGWLYDLAREWNR